MAMTSSTRALAAEINVTPLIDVLLVLLIIFMVIHPATVRGLRTLVPHPPQSSTANSSSEAIVLQVASDRGHGITYWLNQESLPKSAILPRLSGIFALRSNKTMFLEGDANLNFADVAEVIDTSHQAGAENIAILTPHLQFP